MFKFFDHCLSHQFGTPWKEHTHYLPFKYLHLLLTGHQLAQVCSLSQIFHRYLELLRQCLCILHSAKTRRIKLHTATEERRRWYSFSFPHILTSPMHFFLFNCKFPCLKVNYHKSKCWDAESTEVPKIWVANGRRSELLSVQFLLVFWFFSCYFFWCTFS